MKNLNYFLALLLFVSMSNLLQSQTLGSWILPKDPPNAQINQLKFEAQGYSIVKVNPSNPQPYDVFNSAGGYDIAGNVLFYVLNEDAYESTLHSSITYTIGAGINGESLKPEIQIIKNPGGVENSYFIIYFTKGSNGAGANSAIRLSEIEYNIAANGDPYLLIGIQNGIEFTQGGARSSGFGMTKESNGSRDIYFCNSYFGLWESEIDQNGLNSSGTTIITQSSFYPGFNMDYFNSNNLELKIDQNGKKLVAWNTNATGGTDKLFVCTEGTPWTANAYSMGLGRIVGLEFSPAEDNIIYLSCFVAPNSGGIYKVNYTTGTNLGMLAGSGAFNKTFLQTAPDGHIYGVANDGTHLGKIDMNTFGFTANAVPIAVSSQYTDDGFEFYVLPENDFRVLDLGVDTVYVSCPGDCDGIARAIPSIGDSLDYTWEWTDMSGNVISTTNIAENLCEGEYSVCATSGYYNPVTVCDTIVVIVDPNLYTTPGAGGFWSPTLPSYTGENLRFETGIKISGNSTVTFNDCTFEFAKDAKVIVEQGSRLIMNNTTFTSLAQCPHMWQGVEVWGTSDKQQAYDPVNQKFWQGYLMINAGSMIKNAKTAVKLGQVGVSGTTGGVVMANGAIFRNNARALHAYNYPLKSNMSYMKRCMFETNTGYMADYTFGKHIDLNNVKGLKFTSCDFSVIQNIVGISSWNQAINSFNAGFTVNAACSNTSNPCNSYDNSTFDGFKVAVLALNTGINSNTFAVERADFTDNEYGISATSVKYFSVLFSNFSVGYSNPIDGECEAMGLVTAGRGIDMEYCTGFAIEENNFTVPYNTAGTRIGIRCKETQNTDQVYKNTFTGLSYGNYAEGQNWKTGNTAEGLAYYCNQNTGNWQDFYVDTLTTLPSGIQNPIGGISLPAGNTFSPTATWHINNKGDYWIGYFYYEPTNGDTNTVFYPNTDKVWKVTREGVYLYENECLSHYGGGGGGGTGRGLVQTPGEKQEAEQEYYDNQAEYNNVKSLYEYLKDGGNTQLTLSEVESAFPDEMWELRASLLEKSPHLTTEVLKATADKTDVFPDNVIFEIMAANPDELRKGELIKYLAEKENPLPEYMLTVLRQVLETGFTYKTILIGNIAHYNQVKTRAAYNIIRSILNDTVTDVAELRTWLGRLGGKRADEQVIASYMDEENYSQALSLANALPVAYDYDENELIKHGYYMDMLNLMNTLNQQERTVFELDSTEVSNLVYIAENTKGTASAQAKGILEYAYGYHFCDCINSNSTGYKSSGTFNTGNYGQAYGINIIASPNPATDWVAFAYSMNDDNASASVKITDITGKPVTVIPVTGKQGQRICDTRNVSPGVYFYNFNASGENKSGKIVIHK